MLKVSLHAAGTWRANNDSLPENKELSRNTRLDYKRQQRSRLGIRASSAEYCFGFSSNHLFVNNMFFFLYEITPSLFHGPSRDRVLSHEDTSNLFNTVH